MLNTALYRQIINWTGIAHSPGDLVSSPSCQENPRFAQCGYIPGEKLSSLMGMATELSSSQ